MDKTLYEYVECSNNMRHYGNHQVALITAFIAINGAVAAFVFGSSGALKGMEGMTAKLIAVVISILFAIKIQSDIVMWDHFFNLAVKLENGLGLTQYTSLLGYPGYPIRPAKWAIWLFVALTIVFWFLALINEW